MTGVLVTRRTGERPSTYDAYIQAYIVNMASEVSGRIVELNVRDNQQVKEGEVLFQIDPKPYQLSVDQARAAVQGLEAQLAVMTSEVASQTSGAEAAASGISTAEAQLALAASTLDRLEPLLKRGFVMAEQVDQARTAKETARIALERSRDLAAQARQGVNSTKPTEAQLDGARASLALRSATSTRLKCARHATVESLRSKSPPANSQMLVIRSSQSSTPSIGTRLAIFVRPISLGSSPGNGRPSLLWRNHVFR